MTKEQVAAYMGRKCLCGHERSVHMHGHAMGSNGKLGGLISIPCGCCACSCFIDEFELELGGNPSTNEHLGPLVQEPDPSSDAPN